MSLPSVNILHLIESKNRDGVYYKQSITITFQSITITITVQNFQTITITLQSITSITCITFYYIYTRTMKTCIFQAFIHLSIKQKTN